jgi:putative ABC transport system substrate-binding protein
MRRREFITLLGGAAAGWPLAAHAQQPDRAKRIGALMSTAAEDPEGQARMTAFQQKLQQLGWIDGGNIRIDARWSASDAERMRKGAEELVALSPDVILASGGTVLGPLLEGGASPRSQWSGLRYACAPTRPVTMFGARLLLQQPCMSGKEHCEG